MNQSESNKKLNESLVRDAQSGDNTRESTYRANGLSNSVIEQQQSLADEVVEISMKGFEIEDRIFLKYGVTMDQFKHSYSIYFRGKKHQKSKRSTAY